MKQLVGYRLFFLSFFHVHYSNRLKVVEMKVVNEPAMVRVNIVLSRIAKFAEAF